MYSAVECRLHRVDGQYWWKWKLLIQSIALSTNISSSSSTIFLKASYLWLGTSYHRFLGLQGCYWIRISLALQWTTSLGCMDTLRLWKMGWKCRDEGRGNVFACFQWRDGSAIIRSRNENCLWNWVKAAFSSLSMQPPRPHHPLRAAQCALFGKLGESSPEHPHPSQFCTPWTASMPLLPHGKGT